MSHIWRTSVLVLGLSTLSFYTNRLADEFQSGQPKGAKEEDNDWFMLQRAYPYDDIDPARYEQARRIIRQKVRSGNSPPATSWQSVGPSNIGGRITSLAIDPTTTDVVYAGAAAGGVWKSTDGGGTWSNTFNESPSIGALLLDPTNHSTLYVGTGEANPGGVAIYPGNGIWRSSDAGLTWTNLGLANTGQIGKIEMHSEAPNRLFVAALGRYRSRTEDRGIFRSTDRGTSWERVLFLNDTTGACDVLIDPADTNRIIAAMWTRYRPLTYSVIAGPGSGLWLSTDGGDSWNQITDGFPNNENTLGRISLAAAPSQPSIVYALATNGTAVRGVFKSTDRGSSWTMVASPALFSGESQVWYNNVLAVHPTNPDFVFVGMTNFYRSTNGGVGWSNAGGGMHVDHHAVVFHPTIPSRVAVGNDGGVYTSTNTGSFWIKSPNLPISQFYAGTIDYSQPHRYYGGMQDNGTARTLTGSQNDWQGIYGGDGFYVLVDPTNNNRVYVESQNGGLARSTNGGTSFSSARTGISSSDRFNWSTPFAMDRLNTLKLYVGTHRVYRTTNGMVSWTPISGDLTRGANGRIGTITTIDVAPSDSNVVYVGTDDAKVSVTTDGGIGWTDVTGTLPQRWVTRVTVDPDSAHVCYVALSGYLEDSFSAHVYKTTNFGQTWFSIGGDLPDIPVNDVIVDDVQRPLLYIATDVGVMYSTNQGTNWVVLGVELPEVPVHDLTLHSPTRKLLASTHGRSAYIIDLSGIVAARDTREASPAEFVLHQNFPNPFNPWTEIQFTLPSVGQGDKVLTSLVVYDALGREVETLVRGYLGSGFHIVQWNAEREPSGLYFYRLQHGSSHIGRKMVLLK
jgi:photosystem II stability/assembly factor-like uncharacterized protein